MPWNTGALLLVISVLVVWIVVLTRENLIAGCSQFHLHQFDGKVTGFLPAVPTVPAPPTAAPLTAAPEAPLAPLGAAVEGKNGVVTPFSWTERLWVALDAACGLSHMHNSTPKAFHRDIKSANILLDRSGTAKMADFGLSGIAKNKDGATGRRGGPRWHMGMAPSPGRFSGRK
eukprot:s915_g5.t1